MIENIDQFLDLVVDQFSYGGMKYAATDTKESTDILFDDFGGGWLYGTMAKYVKRYSNLARERDLLKIACYAFILFLKRGYHEKVIGSSRPVNTTVDLKAKYFPVFKKKVKLYIGLGHGTFSDPMSLIYRILKKFAKVSFTKITQEDIFLVFALAYRVWNKDIKDKGKDKDTYNEKGEKYGKV